MRILLYGSREFAATVAELVKHCGHEVAGMIDDFNTGEGIVGSLGAAARTHPPGTFGIAMAIGYKDLRSRWSAWERVRALGYAAPALVHPRSYVADSAQIGDGAMVMAGATVDVRGVVGALSVLWPGACLSHDAKLGYNSFLSPNATVCGFSWVGEHGFIGAGAVVVDHIAVPAGEFIKAGSVFHRGRAGS